MTTSPGSSSPSSAEVSNIFERLAGCNNLLTAKEVAQLLAISPKTIYAYVARNMIPHYKIEASVLRFRPKDLADWLRGRAA
jgi:excisionase family DNA binding protein